MSSRNPRMARPPGHTRQRPVSLAASVLAGLLLAEAAASQTEASRVLSAYFGDTIFPNLSNVICPGPDSVIGLGGMPFVVTSRVLTEGFNGDPDALDPSHFTVTVGPEGRVVTPVCATLQPAVDDSERRTILLVGEFGIGGDNAPVSISIVGDVLTEDGSSLRGVTIDDIQQVQAGPLLVLAERFLTRDGSIDTSSDGDGTNDVYCPADSTSLVVKLTFSGGVSGFDGAAFANDPVAAGAIEVVGVGPGGRRVVLAPFTLRDDDGDNHIDACFGAAATLFDLRAVSVDSQYFYAPQNVPNDAGTVEVER